VIVARPLPAGDGFSPDSRRVRQNEDYSIEYLSVARFQIGAIRPIRVDHTDFFKWLLKLIHSLLSLRLSVCSTTGSLRPDSKQYRHDSCICQFVRALQSSVSWKKSFFVLQLVVDITSFAAHFKRAIILVCLK